MSVTDEQQAQQDYIEYGAFGPEPEVAKYPCPDCERVFEGPQGLGAHRRAAHGLKSKRTRSRRRPSAAKLDKAQLLRAIFPDRKIDYDLVYDVQAWLTEGERLYRANRA